MAVQDVVNRIFREFKRYTGDGLPGAPVNAPLPIGDPSSGVHNPKKSELRAAFIEILEGVEDAAEVILGLEFKGNWDSGTSYVAYNVVLYSGSSWIALAPSAGAAPPTLPVASNAYWQLLARRGVDGSGTVASVVAGAGISVNNADPTAPVVSVSGSGAGGIDPLAYIYLAKAMALRTPFKSGIAEGFGMVEGINAGASSGYVLDIGSKRLVNGPPVPSYGADITTTGQAISGGDDSFGAGALAKDKAFNNVTTNGTGWFSSQQGTSVGGVAYIGQDFGSAKTIRRVTVLQNALAVNSLSKALLEYSNNGTTWTTLMPLDGLFYSSTAQVFDVPAVSGGARYWRLLASAQPPSGQGWGVTEIEMMEMVSVGTPANMAIVSNGYDSLDTVPSTIKVTAVLEAIDAATLNTDATMEVSRDNGVTWAAAALTQVSTLGARVLVESALVSVSGQPSGAKPAYRYKTLNNKRVYLHGVAMVGA